MPTQAGSLPTATKTMPAPMSVPTRPIRMVSHAGIGSGPGTANRARAPVTNAVTITEITLAIPRRVAARQDPRRDRDDSRCAVRARAAAAAGRRWRLLRRPAGSPGDRAARARSTGDLLRRRERERQVDPRRGDRRRGEAERRGWRQAASLHDTGVALTAARAPRAGALATAAAERVLPAGRERLQPRHGNRGGRPDRRARGRLRAAVARAVARRVLPRHRGEQARAARLLSLRRTGSRTVGARAACAHPADARARPPALAVRDR